MGNLSHWVLIGPKGKQAGLKAKHEVALQLESLRMTEAGLGGGIIDALLPRTEKERKRLNELLTRGYKIKKVPVRTNRTKSIREAIMDDSLMARLAIYFEREKRNSRCAMKAVNREFSIWICEKLKDIHKNEVRALIESRYPDLGSRIRPDWWKKQLNQRVKQIKK